MKCDSAACHFGPYCWLGPTGKKHYRLRTRLVTYVEKGDVPETHKDVLESGMCPTWRISRSRKKGVTAVTFSAVKRRDCLSTLMFTRHTLLD
ncbi:hypothetical protein N7475_004179 [Penicillium sp. IBT 31633x]|nr:hypothetical protein N7475_004179 [Penicillium sp. IBT 31633x]